MKKRKTLLKERFQQLAGIKPLYGVNEQTLDPSPAVPAADMNWNPNVMGICPNNTPVVSDSEECQGPLAQSGFNSNTEYINACCSAMEDTTVDVTTLFCAEGTIINQMGFFACGGTDPGDSTVTGQFNDSYGQMISDDYNQNDDVWMDINGTLPQDQSFANFANSFFNMACCVPPENSGFDNLPPTGSTTTGTTSQSTPKPPSSDNQEKKKGKEKKVKGKGDEKEKKDDKKGSDKKKTNEIKHLIKKILKEQNVSPGPLSPMADIGSNTSSPSNTSSGPGLDCQSGIWALMPLNQQNIYCNGNNSIQGCRGGNRNFVFQVPTEIHPKGRIGGEYCGCCKKRPNR